jgi:Co/Zn/Cd efflux system component
VFTSQLKEVTMSAAQSFAHTGFAHFINTVAGRVLRLVAGIALIVWGYSLLDETLGVVLIIIGLIPLIAGALDLCVISALLGGPLAGKKVREISLKP